MDIFCEYMVEKRKNAKDYAILCGILIATFVLLFLATEFLGVFGFPIICFIPWGAYELISRQNVEYEYIVTNSVLDIDKIMAKKARKRLVSVDFKEIKSFDNANSIPTGVKIIDATPNGLEDGVYKIECSVKGERTVILFKPNAKVLTNLKKSNPSMVTVNFAEIEE